MSHDNNQKFLLPFSNPPEAVVILMTGCILVFDFRIVVTLFHYQLRQQLQLLIHQVDPQTDQQHQVSAYTGPNRYGRDRVQFLHHIEWLEE